MPKYKPVQPMKTTLFLKMLTVTDQKVISLKFILSGLTNSKTTNEQASHTMEDKNDETKIIIERNTKEYSRKSIFLKRYLSIMEIAKPIAQVIVLLSILFTVISIMPLNTNTCWK